MRKRRWSGLVLPLLLTGCGEELTEPDDVLPGSLVVRVATAGEPLNAERYPVHIEPLDETFELGLTDTLQLPDLAPDWYTATVGIPDNCAVLAGARQTVSVDSDAEAVIDFDIDCHDGWWVTQSAPSSRINQIVFKDSLMGFLAVRTGHPAPPEPAMNFYVTEDGGSSWTLRASPSTDTDVGTFLYFVNDEVAFTGGQDLTVFRTEDAGRSWAGTRIGTTFHHLLSAHFLDPETGWIGGGGGRLYQTRDGGSTWNQVQINFTQAIFGIFFADTLNGVITGSIQGENSAYFTTDGGATWTTRPTGAPLHLQGMAFLDDTTGVAVGDGGAIVRTTDRGWTWTVIESPTEEVLWSVDFGADGFGVAAGQNGTILVTEDGGLSWRPEPGASPPCCATVSVVDAGHAWVGGRGSLLRRRFRD